MDYMARKMDPEPPVEAALHTRSPPDQQVTLVSELMTASDHWNDELA